MIRRRCLKSVIISTYLFPCVAALLEKPIELADYDKKSAVICFALAYHPVICSSATPVFYFSKGLQRCMDTKSTALVAIYEEVNA